MRAGCREIRDESCERVVSNVVVTKPAINLYYKQSSVLILCHLPAVKFHDILYLPVVVRALLSRGPRRVFDLICLSGESPTVSL